MNSDIKVAVSKLTYYKELRQYGGYLTHKDISVLVAAGFKHTDKSKLDYLETESKQGRNNPCWFYFSEAPKDCTFKIKGKLCGEN